MSRRDVPRRRRRGPRQRIEGAGKTKLPFPYSILTNVKLFYAVGIIVIVIGLIGGVLVSFGNNSSDPPPTPSPASRNEDDSAAISPPEGEDAPSAQFKTYEAPPPMTIDSNKTYVANIETEKGSIKAELLAKDAPQAVNNFVFLAHEGFYDGLSFHYVLKGFLAMTGDPACREGFRCSGLDGPGYSLPEDANDLKPEAGALVMVGQDSVVHGSQFYIAYDDVSAQANKSDVVFGRVLEGIDVLQSLSETNPRLSPAPAADHIRSISIQETSPRN